RRFTAHRMADNNVAQNERLAAATREGKTLSLQGSGSFRAARAAA
ncbi:MAG: glycosyltransferase family 4 protein, partial [Nevskia sp.]|nr:glycosyltransferase family 4 protein [Nevskia sp.]